MRYRFHRRSGREFSPAAPILLLLASVACGESAGPAMDLDTAGLAPFWAAHDILARDAEPPDSVWDAMWSTPGYALLDAKERRRPALTQAIRLAYRPSLLGAADTASGWAAYVLPHLRAVPAVRDSLAGLLETVGREGWFPRARTAAERYLPAGITARYPAPDVSLIYFIDARGYSERLLLDPLHFLRLTNPVAVVAHEFHHYYRSHVERSHADYGDDLLAWVLSTVESEGIPGLLDKADVPQLTPAQLAVKYPDPARYDYFATYQVEYRRPDVRLRQTEDVLERVGAHPDSQAPLGRWLHRELPDNGRILGAFMAAEIERTLGLDRLVAVVGDPFGFWRLYGEAADRDPALPRGLSADALGILDELEERYR